MLTVLSFQFCTGTKKKKNYTKDFGVVGEKKKKKLGGGVKIFLTGVLGGGGPKSRVKKICPKNFFLRGVKKKKNFGGGVEIFLRSILGGGIQNRA